MTAMAAAKDTFDLRKGLVDRSDQPLRETKKSVIKKPIDWDEEGVDDD